VTCWRKSRLTLLFVSALLAAALIDAATASSVRSRTAIYFQTIAHRFSSGKEPTKPTVFVALQASDIVAFERFLRPEDARRVHNTNFAESAVVAVFAGPKPSTGYRITVRRLTVDQRLLRIIVELRRPSPETPVLPAFSSPYHVVKVAQRALGPSGPSRWLLVSVTGHTLARGSL
jgi:PrcB C-terminal